MLTISSVARVFWLVLLLSGVVAGVGFIAFGVVYGFTGNSSSEAGCVISLAWAAAVFVAYLVEEARTRQGLGL